ncbi:laminin subunit gamma-3-like [Branchiostoma floridae]|uniref:Laminin subunit gamma-3-like n=1 Tax=Branchiostoma floridae TaxID=7739 RepID=A0A9J7K8H2_BRAFL|nr:laminin subunit gamma-3-like [Branchiostoma floridae]
MHESSVGTVILCVWTVLLTDAACPDTAFSCNDGFCIDRSLRCNGVTNCFDSSDELDCPGGGGNSGNTAPSPPRTPTPARPVPQCGAEQHLCRPGWGKPAQCITAKRLCDGVPDCWDQSDEKECAVKSGPCHGHSNIIEDGIGRCLGCKHHTAGWNCELCEEGYFGDATKGTPEDCRPMKQCLCHGHSNRCDSTGVCKGCKHNTEGLYCERCKEGYVGVATAGTPEDCRRKRADTPACQCNGHAKFCDEKGRCLNCRHNTMGQMCERCKPGYVGNPRQQTPRDCSPLFPGCNCHGHSLTCDASGKCTFCAHNTVGDRCQKCLPGYVGDARRGTATDCQQYRPAAPCMCNGHAKQCDRLGTCMNCQHNTEGPRCERCKSGYHGDATKGTADDCQPVRQQCFCHGHSQLCDTQGRCQKCQHNTVGAFCEMCEQGFTGDATQGTPRDCVRSRSQCFCHGHAATCDVLGRCLNCQHNTAGPQCESCKPGYVGDPTSGSPLSCRPQQAAGHWCNCNGHSVTCDATGNCLNCLHNTEGPRCQSCRPGYRGDPTRGTPYDCVPVVTWPQEVMTCHQCHGHSDLCDNNGRCYNCQHNTVGLFCERCKPGFTGIATSGSPWACRPVVPVTEPECQCHGHAYTCDAEGRCKNCLHNTAGDRCQYCIPGYVGDATSGTPMDCSPAGVVATAPQTSCECHGHAALCNQDGQCKDCRHNTAGDFCERCAPGYYGDATRGKFGDCAKCPCPLTVASNSFAKTCILAQDGRPTCSNCRRGYVGRNCERCAQVWTGDPKRVGGRCTKDRGRGRQGRRRQGRNN